MKVKIGSGKDSVNFDGSNEAKNFIEKRFREFQDSGQKRLEIKVRK